jgi:hypothetical protein
MLQPGLMMDMPLMLSSILEHAASQYGDVEVVARETPRAAVPLHLRTVRRACPQVGQRAGRPGPGAGACGGIDRLEQPPPPGGVLRRVGQRHGHAYLQSAPAPAATDLHHQPCRGPGWCCSTPPSHHWSRGIAAHCPQVRHWVCLSEAAHMPAIEGVANVIAYEDLIAPCSDQFAWPQFDERSAAALCYTSGTTGNPKGALYSHRSIVLNAISICSANALGLSTQADHPAGGADVPHQCLVHSVCRADRRHPSWSCPAQTGRSLAVRTDGIRARDG